MSLLNNLLWILGSPIGDYGHEWWVPCSQPLNASSPRYLENLALFETIKLPVSLPQSSNHSIVDGYEDCDELTKDFEQILAEVVNNLIWRQMNYCYETEMIMYVSVGGGIQGGVGLFPESDSVSIDTTTSDEIIDESSFETNNQEKDVDEADVVKSDGTFVYTVYGNEIVVLDLEGIEQDRLNLFPGRKQEDYYFASEIDPILGEPILPLSNPFVQSLQSMLFELTRNIFTRLQAFFPDIQAWASSWFPQFFIFSNNWYFRPRSPIKGLLLDEDRLIAIVSDSGWPKSTEVVLMQIDVNDGSLSILERDIYKGRYETARKVDSIVHLISVAYIQSFWYTQLNSLERNNVNLTAFNDTEYAHLAFATASLEIPSYAEMLVADILSYHQKDENETNIENGANLTFSGDTCNHIVKISSEEKVEENPLDALYSYSRGHRSITAFLQVISFDIHSSLDESHFAGTFVPSSYPDIYASSDMLFVGSRKYDPFSMINGTYEISTEIIAFEFQNASAVPKAIGSVPGGTLNQFSYDFYDGNLRVATTSRATISEPSTNRVVVASIQDESIEIIGSLEGLGVTEEIYSVRFLDDVAFMVTFRRTDPFYTIDLSTPETPVMRGELKIPGFSNYLHPINEIYILAIGQDADEETGFLLGLQVAIFDVSDLDNPKQISKHVVDGWSSSSSQHDHHAFRFLTESKKLILPVSTSSFDGFHVYDIDPEFNIDQGEEGIRLDFLISHFDTNDSGLSCFSSFRLAPRSLVFQGDVMTLKGHNVLSHDLNTGKELFEIELDTLLDNEEVCFDWF